MTTLDEWMEAWERAVLDGQSSISRGEAIRRWEDEQSRLADGVEPPNVNPEAQIHLSGGRIIKVQKWKVEVTRGRVIVDITGILGNAESTEETEATES